MTLARMMMAYVKDAMTMDIEPMEPRRTALEAARVMAEHAVDALVVADGGHLLGMVTQADIVRAVAAERDLAATAIAEIMLPEVLFCYDDQRIEDAAAKMRASLVRRLPVLSKDKTIIGMISEDDLGTAEDLA
ncbi:MAG: CBS domain-containing protein [Rhodospirillales bacterium]|jgi:CBS domain-containing protein|nr:CBS domain-containing protein [Rhodospirillales bacterium]